MPNRLREALYSLWRGPASSSDKLFHSSLFPGVMGFTKSSVCMLFTPCTIWMSFTSAGHWLSGAWYGKMLFEGDGRRCKPAIPSHLELHPGPLRRRPQGAV